METVIRRASDEKQWEIFTEDRRVITKLTKLYGPGESRHPQSDGLWWVLPASGVSFRKPRVMTEEQRAAAALRLKEAREGQ